MSAQCEESEITENVKDCKHLKISQNEICLECGKSLSEQDIRKLGENSEFVETQEYTQNDINWIAKQFQQTEINKIFS